LEPFNILSLEYRWIKPMNLVVYNQENHLVPLNASDILFRFEIKGDYELHDFHKESQTYRNSHHLKVISQKVH
jgi:hypothetical protein